VLYLAILVLLTTATTCLFFPRWLQRVVLAWEDDPASVRGRFLASPQYLAQLEGAGLVSLLLAILLLLYLQFFLY